MNRAAQITFFVVCATLVGLAARTAQGRLIDFTVGGTAGGMTGWGKTPQTPDFFDVTRGPGVGVDLGLKLLFFDLSASFLQVLDGSGTAGTLYQVLLGTNLDISLGGTLADGHSQNVLTPKVAIGAGWGTPGPVSPPLTASQIAAKGFVANGSLAYEYFLNPFLALGVQATYGYHYFFGGDITNAVNVAHSYSSGYHVLGLATATFHLGF